MIKDQRQITNIRENICVRYYSCLQITYIYKAACLFHSLKALLVLSVLQIIILFLCTS